MARRGPSNGGLFLKIFFIVAGMAYVSVRLAQPPGAHRPAAQVGSGPAPVVGTFRGEKPGVVKPPPLPPLHLAAFVGNAPEAAHLLENGYPIDERNQRGDTPLFLAASRGHLAVVQRLVEQGANISAVCGEGETPLLMAMFHRHRETAQFLFERGADIQVKSANGLHMIHTAAKCGLRPVVAKLLDEGIPPDLEYGQGWRPIHYAAQEGHTEVVKLLLERGASTVVRVCGHSPLEMARGSGRHDIVALLEQPLPAEAPLHRSN